MAAVGVPWVLWVLWVMCGCCEMYGCAVGAVRYSDVGVWVLCDVLWLPWVWL